MPLQWCLAPAEQSIPGPSGIDLSVETHGDISSPLAIVMIHGGYQSRRCFQFQYPTLAFDHFVVGLDLPGHGESSFPEKGTKLSSALYAESVQSVITGLHIEHKPLVLLGWSFGGLVCRAYLDRYGHTMNIVGLIQLASLFGGFAPYMAHMEQDPFFHPVLTSFGEGAEGEREEIVHTRFLASFVDRLTLTNSRLSEDMRYAIRGYNEQAWHNFRSFGAPFLQDQPSEDTLQALTTVTLPTLLLHGKEDALVPFSFSYAMQQQLPHAKLVEIDRCGHSSMLERPEIVNRAIGEFLAGMRGEQ